MISVLHYKGIKLMKSVFFNFFLIIAVAGLYYLGFFKFFTYKETFWGVMALLVFLLLLGVKIIGLPRKENRK